jgi:hypothetical protein
MYKFFSVFNGRFILGLIVSVTVGHPGLLMFQLIVLEQYYLHLM